MKPEHKNQIKNKLIWLMEELEEKGFKSINELVRMGVFSYKKDENNEEGFTKEEWNAIEIFVFLEKKVSKIYPKSKFLNLFMELCDDFIDSKRFGQEMVQICNEVGIEL